MGLHVCGLCGHVVCGIVEFVVAGIVGLACLGMLGVRVCLHHCHAQVHVHVLEVRGELDRTTIQWSNGWLESGEGVLDGILVASHGSACPHRFAPESLGLCL